MRSVARGRRGSLLRRAVWTSRASGARPKPLPKLALGRQVLLASVWKARLGIRKRHPATAGKDRAVARQTGPGIDPQLREVEIKARRKVGPTLLEVERKVHRHFGRKTRRATATSVCATDGDGAGCAAVRLTALGSLACIRAGRGR